MNTDRADDVVAVARLSAQTGAVDAILAWLAKRVHGAVLLLSTEGRVLNTDHSTPRPERSIVAAASRAVRDMHRTGTPSAVLRDAARTIDVISLNSRGESSAGAGSAAPAPYLVVIGCEDRQHALLLTDTARILGLCWRVEEAEGHRRRVESAEARSRETVLQLLMIGNASAAQRIAATLRPSLPDQVRLHIVECPSRRRNQVSNQVQHCARGRAWVVPCSVRNHHLIVLVPTDAATHLDQLNQRITQQIPESRVGMSEEVALQEIATGYQQAFHALTVARSASERYARFDHDTDPAPLLGSAGHTWAWETLRPCLGYVPDRRTDPGPEHLLDTLSSWLTFDSGATRYLKIHRNTLAARLRLLNELLGMDLSLVADQSAAWLALRLCNMHGTHAPPDHSSHVPTLDALLETRGMSAWAQAQLRPLERSELVSPVDTVAAWLRSDARVSPTATALGISLAGARKRLFKIEQVLGRSLLHAPGAKHELWLAMRALGSL